MNAKNNEKGAKKSHEGDGAPKKSMNLGNMTGKPLSDIHRKDKFEQSAQDSALLEIYKENAEAIADKPKAPKLKAQISKLQKFRGFYKLYSICSGGAFGGAVGFLLFWELKPNLESFFTENIGDIGTYGVMALLMGAITYMGYLLADWNENTKIDNAKEYFAPLPKNRNGKYMGTVLRSTFLSIVISAVGIGFIVFMLTDNTGNIETQTDLINDSIRNDYASQIEVLDVIITENREKLANGGKWDKYHAGNAIKDAQRQKTELKKLQATDLKDLKSESKSEIFNAKKQAQTSAIGGGLFTIICEIFFILTFASEWKNRRAIETESVNHEINTPAHAYDNTPTQTISIDEIAKQVFLHQLLGQNLPSNAIQGITMQSNTMQSNTVNGNTINDNTVKRVGFQVGNSGDSHTVDSKLKSEKHRITMDYTNDVTFMGYATNGNPKFKQGELRKCDNCGKEYRITHWSKRFCCDECKYEHHGFDLEKYKIAKYGK